MNNMEASERIIDIGIAELKFAESPAILSTRGLGSCLAITLYEPFKKLGCLAHPMLPSMENARIKTNPMRFVDSVISLMMDEFQKRDCLIRNLEAKLFGGAHMFSSIPVNSVFNIGVRNLEAARKKLKFFGVRIAGEDSGKDYGRTVFFDLQTGKVRVRTLFFGESEI